MENHKELSTANMDWWTAAGPGQAETREQKGRDTGLHRKWYHGICEVLSRDCISLDY